MDEFEIGNVHEQRPCRAILLVSIEFSRYVDQTLIHMKHYKIPVLSRQATGSG